jgi:hypothetical protein
MTTKRTIGFWILVIIGILYFFVIGIMGQVMTVINYDFVASIGMQESVDVIGEMGVAVERGLGVGDMTIHLPLLAIGIVGLWLRKPWGLFTMAGALAIMAYWPIGYIFYIAFAKGSPGFNVTDITSYIIMLPPFTVYGLWGFWYLYKNRKVLTSEE